MGINNQKGSSLVEVMVALFVLAIGLLGVLAMQSKSMQYNQSAHVYSQAVYLANDIAERVRSNTDPAANYAVAIPGSEPTDCKTVACGAAALAAWDLYWWNQNIQNFLPAGAGAIEPVVFDGRNFLNIQVSFDDSRADGKAPGSEQDYTGRKSYALMVEI